MLKNQEERKKDGPSLPENKGQNSCSDITRDMVYVQRPRPGWSEMDFVVPTKSHPLASLVDRPVSRLSRVLQSTTLLSGVSSVLLGVYRNPSTTVISPSISSS